ncbi:MAG: penicillin-binding protein activator LpoB [Candidatus Delongbacteria bacterium]|nr:penicillin-binding protein activator LpoB [Candidatus Delongbacteria bacterium]MBN2835684.1 penicillin-binding protein activator LpoB [Candidatus Delongbacteria bacterium]
MQKLGIVFIMMVLIFSCSKEVTRTEISRNIDLSGKWNDTDSRLVADEMIKEMSTASWYNRFMEDYKKTPDLVVGKIRNKSSEHISTSTFVKDIERAFVNGGTINFVAAKTDREDLKDEMDDQMFGPDSEISADIMLSGEINSIIDKEGDESVRYYQVDLTLLDIKSKRKIWMGSKKIKKLVEENKLKF